MADSKTEALQLARDALEEIALAGMSGTGEESPEAMNAWHARRAREFIGIAARALDPIRAALTATSAPAEPLQVGFFDDGALNAERLHELWTESNHALDGKHDWMSQLAWQVASFTSRVMKAALATSAPSELAPLRKFVEHCLTLSGGMVSGNLLKYEAEKVLAEAAAPQPAPAVRLTEFECAARNVQHALLHDGPGDVVIALREQLLPVLAGVIEECGYLPDLKPAEPWYPIETAPRDGSKFLGYRARDGKIAEARFVPRDDGEMWEFAGSSGGHRFFPSIKPTHWRPRPAEPGDHHAPSAAQPEAGVRICPEKDAECGTHLCATCPKAAQPIVAYARFDGNGNMRSVWSVQQWQDRPSKSDTRDVVMLYSGGAAEPMLNGLTEAETAASASVAGLTQPEAPAEPSVSLVTVNRAPNAAAPFAPSPSATISIGAPHPAAVVPEAYEQGISAMAKRLREILDGNACLASEPPELAEVARRLAVVVPAELSEAKADIKHLNGMVREAVKGLEERDYLLRALFENIPHNEIRGNPDSPLERARAILAASKEKAS